MIVHDTRNAPVLFISDLHLDPARPEIIRLFLAFLADEASRAQALYILGDLFEAWIGDDAVEPDHPVVTGLRGLAGAGIPLRIMRGNRDFLLGERFERLTDCTLLPDPSVVQIDGEPVMLMHGDSLCIDDADYQRFRAMVRDPQWQREFLSKTVEERIAYAKQARAESTSRNAMLNDSPDDYLMDVNAGAVETAMREHGVRRLIHGHTHRPDVHDITVDGDPARRIVLGDWYDQGSVLRVNGGEYVLSVLPVPGVRRR